MNPEAEKKPEDQAAAPTAQAVPEDALEMSNEELGNAAAASSDGATPDGDKPPKKPSGLKAFFKKVNVYLLLFVLVLVIAAAFSIVSYLNGKKAPKTPTVATQQLTQDTLKQLANSDATVGDSGQTLTVQGNAIFSGQVLVRSNLDVAGTIQLGGTLSVPGLTVSGTTNLATTQINTLQVANNTELQGTTTVKDLNVAGAASFGSTLTASQITVTKLILAGNASLQVPNHIAFTGASPGRSINSGVLGAGGSASVNGSDTSGTVNINSGNNPTAGCFITMTFNQSYSNAPHVIVTPVGAAAGQINFYVNRSTTSFSICGDNAAPANQTFAFDYFVTN